MLRIQNRSLSAAFNAWHDKTRDQKQLRYNLHKLMTRWQRLQLAGPFNAWHDTTRAQKHLRYNLRKLVTRMRNRSLSAAFNAWHDKTHDNLNEKKAQAAALDRAQRIVLRMRNRSLSAAFNAWHAHMLGGGIHSSTSQLNLSRFCHSKYTLNNPSTPPIHTLHNS